MPPSRNLPLSHVVNNDVFVTHGGLPRKDESRNGGRDSFLSFRSRVARSRCDSGSQSPKNSTLLSCLAGVDIDVEIVRGEGSSGLALANWPQVTDQHAHDFMRHVAVGSRRCAWCLHAIGVGSGSAVLKQVGPTVQGNI